MAFCAFLRIGVITKTSGLTQHFILFGNVTIKSDAQHGQYIEITIPHFKHAKSSTSTIRLQQNKTYSNICPHKCLMQYLSIRKHDSPSKPLFSFMDGVPVSRQFFTEQLQLALSFCNLNLHQCQTHSFRIGAGTTAAARGFSELQIQHMRRWKSNALKKYIRIPTLQLWDICSLWFSFRTFVISQGLMVFCCCCILGCFFVVGLFVLQVRRLVISQGLISLEHLPSVRGWWIFVI